MHHIGFFCINDVICYLLIVIILFQYIIGYFEPENKYSIIPINWLKKGKSNHLKCLWPDYRVTSMIIMKSAKPSSKWTIHIVKLVS